MKIKDLLNTPDKWTQGVYAKDIHGATVMPHEPKAYAFCLVGAMRLCYPEQEQQADIKKKIKDATGSSTITYNDMPGRTHAEVLELVTKLDI